MLTTSTMPRTPRGVGMNKSTKKKQVSVEPLQEPPNPMSPCEPAAPQVETFEEKVARATRSMSPEKSRVVRLCMEADARDKCCADSRECQRQCQRQVKFLKRSMRDVRARQNLVPKARTKKELAQRKADEEMLAAIRKDYHNDESSLTLVGTESTLSTLPCQGRVTCSGGPRGPPGGVLRVVICSSTLKLPVPRQFRPRRDEFRTMRALSSGLSCVTLIAGKP